MGRLRATHAKAYGPANATTTISAVWTPASGLVVRVMGGYIGAGGAGVVHVMDGTAASAGTIATLQVPANDGHPFDLGDGLRASAADMPLGIKANSGTINNVAATFVGREEAF